ncbi:MAG: hypothetical protein SGILL_008617 [Bacillariaceae sp.]
MDFNGAYRAGRAYPPPYADNSSNGAYPESDASAVPFHHVMNANNVSSNAQWNGFPHQLFSMESPMGMNSYGSPPPFPYQPTPNYAAVPYYPAASPAAAYHAYQANTAYHAHGHHPVAAHHVQAPYQANTACKSPFPATKEEGLENEKKRKQEETRLRANQRRREKYQQDKEETAESAPKPLQQQCKHCGQLVKVIQFEEHMKSSHNDEWFKEKLFDGFRAHGKAKDTVLKRNSKGKVTKQIRHEVSDVIRAHCFWEEYKSLEALRQQEIAAYPQHVNPEPDSELEKRFKLRPESLDCAKEDLRWKTDTDLLWRHEHEHYPKSITIILGKEEACCTGFVDWDRDRYHDLCPTNNKTKDRNYIITGLFPHVVGKMMETHQCRVKKPKDYIGGLWRSTRGAINMDTQEEKNKQKRRDKEKAKLEEEELKAKQQPKITSFYQPISIDDKNDDKVFEFDLEDDEDFDDFDDKDEDDEASDDDAGNDDDDAADAADNIDDVDIDTDRALDTLQSFRNLHVEVENDSSLPSSTRERWELPIRTLLVLAFLCNFSGGQNDDKVMHTYFAFEKYGMTEYEYLINAGWRELLEMQIVLLYCGVNFWTKGPARLIGMAKRIEAFHSGKLPTTPGAWYLFDGVGYKITCLIFQDVLKKLFGVVTDTHVRTSISDLGFSRFSKKSQAVKMSKSLSRWIPKNKWKEVNESLGGLHQIWTAADKEQRAKILKLAEKHGILQEFKIVMKVKA